MENTNSTTFYRKVEDILKSPSEWTLHNVSGDGKATTIKFAEYDYDNILGCKIILKDGISEKALLNTILERIVVKAHTATGDIQEKYVTLFKNLEKAMGLMNEIENG
jgi:hypothetical protein